MKKSLLYVALLFATTFSYAQFYEGFENTTGPDALPSTNWTLASGNWTVFNNDPTATARWNITSNVSTPPQVYDGINSAFCNRSTSFANGTVENYLVTPLVVMPVFGQIRFYTRTSSIENQGTIYQVRLALSLQGLSDPNSSVILQEWTDATLNTGSTLEYEQKIIDVSAYAGIQLYVAFVMKQEPITAPFGDQWFIDNLSIDANTDCINSTLCPQYVKLIPFLDSNANGIKDADEPNFPYGSLAYQINNSGTTLYGTSLNGTYYIFDNNPANSYDFSYNVNSTAATYYSCTTTHDNITIPAGSGITTLYFPVTVTLPYIDARVSLSTIGQPRPGFTYYTTINYTNNGSQTIANGTLTFSKDAQLTITNIYQAGTTPTADGFSFDFTNLAPFETRSITVEFYVPTIPTIQLGDLLTNSATITVANDDNLSNNVATITQAIIGSYDPNDITESHGPTIIFDDFTANDYLTYTIQFENTGTANADFIRIEDALDSQLDESTFELISASHDVNVRQNASMLTFHFYDINLPPSSINIDGGYGYVQFKIKPKPGYNIGTIIPNTASIFFDYNPPIITNTFETEFVQNLSTSTFTKDNVLIYPNPATNFVQIALNNSAEKIQTVELMDILGKTIIAQQHVASNETKLNTSSLAKGMYLIKITSDLNVSIVKKLVVQ